MVISGKYTVKEKKKNRNNQKHSAGEDSSICLLCEWEFNYFCQVTVRHKSELWSCLKSVWVGQVFRFMYRGNGVDLQRETAASRLCSQTSEMEILMAQRREFFADFLYGKALFLRQFSSALLLWRLICEDMCPTEAVEHAEHHSGAGMLLHNVVVPMEATGCHAFLCGLEDGLHSHWYHFLLFSVLDRQRPDSHLWHGQPADCHPVHSHWGGVLTCGAHLLQPSWPP